MGRLQGVGTKASADLQSVLSNYNEASADLQSVLS